MAVIRMSDNLDLMRLQAWFSPAFPIGAFAYSQGLEAAVVSEVVSNQDELRDWITDQMNYGAGWNDAVLLAEAWRLTSQCEPLENVLALARSINYSGQRLRETIDQGTAFLNAATCWGDWQQMSKSEKCPLPIAVGLVGALHNIGLEKILCSYLHAYVSNQIQAALRLMRIGQQSGVTILAELEEEIVAVAGNAAGSNLDDLGNGCLLAEVMSMHHETLQCRIFKS